MQGDRSQESEFRREKAVPTFLLTPVFWLLFFILHSALITHHFYRSRSMRLTTPCTLTSRDSHT